MTVLMDLSTLHTCTKPQNQFLGISRASPRRSIRMTVLVDMSTLQPGTKTISKKCKSHGARMPHDPLAFTKQLFCSLRMQGRVVIGCRLHEGSHE